MSDLTVIRKAVSSAKSPYLALSDGNPSKIEAKFNKEAANAILAFEKNPYLQKCTPASVRSAIIAIAQTDLTLNPAMQMAYLVPRKNKKEGTIECQLMPSYIGMIEIARRSGQISTIQADVVYQGEELRYGVGVDFRHVPALDRDENAEPIAAYCYVKFKDGSTHVEVKGRNWIHKRRDMSESKDSSYSPWAKWEVEMWIKTIVRYTYKFLPKTPEMFEAAEAFDNAAGIDFESREAPEKADEKKQHLDAINGTANLHEFSTAWAKVPAHLKEDADIVEASDVKESELKEAALNA